MAASAGPHLGFHTSLVQIMSNMRYFCIILSKLGRLKDEYNANPEDEADTLLFRFQFGHRLKLKFLGAWITFDARLLTYHKLGDVLGLATLIGSRRRRNMAPA